MLMVHFTYGVHRTGEKDGDTMKKLQSIIAILLLAVFVLSFDQVSAIISAAWVNDYNASLDSESSDLISDLSGDNVSFSEVLSGSGYADLIDEVVFPHDEVIEVNIEMDISTYEDMVANAMLEEYVLADITFNGYTYNNIAIRPKGNSSLKQVAGSGGDRLSFKIDFDKYVDGQSMFGITKINLNNLFEDPTLMAEYISYEMLDSIDAVASDTTYVSLSINGEYRGLYLAVEEVNETFLMENFGNYDGQLYKPDMLTGSDLVYISDDPEDYSGVVPQDDDMETDENFVELVKIINEIAENGAETEDYTLSDVMNVDSFLKYLAVSTAVVHLDSYQSAMFHNYYLYFNTDTEKFEWITWDLNMSFNGFPMPGITDLEATEFLIDEPVVGDMSQYPLVQAIFTNGDYVETYHEYLEELIEGYMDTDTFETTVLDTYRMIEPYASIDPTAFYDMTTVKQSIFDDEADNATVSILEFVELRSENMTGQLDGTIASTNDGQGNDGNAGMGGGKGGGQMGDFGGMKPGMQGDDSELSAEAGVGQGQAGMKGGRQKPGEVQAGQIPGGEAPTMSGMDRNTEVGMTGGDITGGVNLMASVSSMITLIGSFGLASGFGIYLLFRKY